MKPSHLAAGAALVIALAGCSAPAPADAATLTVLAAASLTDTFTALGRQFEAANPGVTVRLAFDGSSTLVSQIQEGAPADVFASADTANMDKLTAAGLVDGEPTVFTANSLVLAVSAENPGGVTALSDLASPDITTVVCAPEVPCGAVAERVLAAAGVEVKPVSLEQNVKAVVTKVQSGEADAGLVYGTDVLASGGALIALALPDDAAVTEAARTAYPVAVVAGTAQAELARAFIEFLLGPAGQAVLTEAGFSPIEG